MDLDENGLFIFFKCLALFICINPTHTHSITSGTHSHTHTHAALLCVVAIITIARLCQQTFVLGSWGRFITNNCGLCFCCKTVKYFKLRVSVLWPRWVQLPGWVAPQFTFGFTSHFIVVFFFFFLLLCKICSDEGGLLWHDLVSKIHEEFTFKTNQY